MCDSIIKVTYTNNKEPASLIEVRDGELEEKIKEVMGRPGVARVITYNKVGGWELVSRWEEIKNG